MKGTLLHAGLRADVLNDLWKPVSPSTQQQKMSRSPRFCNSVNTFSQNFTPLLQKGCDWRSFGLITIMTCRRTYKFLISSLFGNGDSGTSTFKNGHNFSHPSPPIMFIKRNRSSFLCLFMKNETEPWKTLEYFK